MTMQVLGPEVRIASISSYFGWEVTVPVNFTSNAMAVAAAAVSVDFDVLEGVMTSVQVVDNRRIQVEELNIRMTFRRVGEEVLSR